ncbi:MAG TPA: TPM domain-containing protein [Myxococcaceae bacterium]|nr:TPM domain-containing protein [Myxococcaceae bacterium]
MPSRAWGPLCATLLLLVAGSARAFNVPKQTDYVTDTAGKLSAAELTDLNNRIGDYERKSTNQIFVLVTPSLDGEPIEDVGYQLIQTWHPGQKGKDNGVVLIIATGERRIRIETGKGVGGELTDLQSNDIIRRRIAPLMRQDRVHDAILAGVDGIAEALSGNATTPRQPGQRPVGAPQQAPVTLPHWFDVCFWGFVLFVVVMLLLRASRHPRRRTYWGGPPFIGGGGWGGGGGGWGGGGGGDDGGSGFSGGGGGEGGGGGSSDSY